MSTTGGSAWSQLNSGNIIYGNDLQLGSIYMAGDYEHDGNYSTPRVMGFFKTTDNGANWTKYNIDELTGSINAFLIHPSDDNILIAGGQEIIDGNRSGCVFISTNAGVNWTEVGSGLIDSDWTIFSLCRDPFNQDHLIASGNYSNYFSTDGGDTWQESGTAVGITCFGIDNSTPNRFFGGTWEGVYITTDGGVTWDHMTTDGMLDDNVNAIEYDHLNNTLFVGTQNGGVHRYTIATGVDDPEEDQKTLNDFQLFQNYPNPFNSGTVIQYTVPEKSQVTIRIYNLLGKEIQTILNEQKEAGVYKTSWNGVDHSGSDVPSGIYLYRLKAGDFTETRKLILTR